MNREIKFRAWHPTQKMTLTPILKRNDFSGEVYCEGFTKDGSRCLLALMQYTGLKDKIGVEIYEGDIVLVKGARICEIVFHAYAGRWDLKLIRIVSQTPIGNVSPSLYEYHAEVIGNTYENPELLNK